MLERAATFVAIIDFGLIEALAISHKYAARSADLAGGNGKLFLAQNTLQVDKALLYP